MYDYIKGVLEDKRKTEKGCYITVDNNGIGFRCEIPTSDFMQMPEKNTEVKVYVSLIHKEDTMFLCGFLNRETRDIFQILLYCEVQRIGLRLHPSRTATTAS